MTPGQPKFITAKTVDVHGHGPEEQKRKGIHPDLLPPRSGIIIMAPADDIAENRIWFVGFVSKDGDPVPLGRIVWFGDMVAAGPAELGDCMEVEAGPADENGDFDEVEAAGMELCVMEESHEPPPDVLPFVLQHLGLESKSAMEPRTSPGPDTATC